MYWFTHWQMSALWVLVAVVLMIKVEMGKWSGWAKLSLITSLFFVANFNHLFIGVDIAKNMRHDLNAFVEQIPQDKRDRTAGIRFSETMSSIFYLYNDWAVPIVDKERAQRILDGQDSQYDYLIVDRNNSLQDPILYAGLPSDTPYRVLLVGHPRADKKTSAVLWLTGKGNTTAPIEDTSKQN